jgi:hypothetical protein
MSNITTTDVLAVSEEMSFTDHEVLVSTEQEIQFCASVAAEELASGVDRSRFSIGFGDEQNYYSLTAAGSSTFSATLSAGRTVCEMVYRLINPEKSLIIGFPYFMAQVLAGNEADFDIANSVHLDYMERHLPDFEASYGTVSMQDLRDGNGLPSYDMIFAHMPVIAHDIQMIEHLYNALNVGGALVLNSAHDQSNVFVHAEKHPYSEIFSACSLFEGANVYQVPVGLGIAVVTKSS